MFTRQFLTQASLGLVLALGFVPPTLAQIVPNGAGTVVNPQGNQINITGGTQAGANLFHSFRDFNVNSAQVANFLSNPQIQNILARINGGNPSFINGLLQVTGGNSNLFLMNPAGIVFGQGASLNIPASFTATTANQIGFGNNLFNAFGDNNFSALIGNPDSFIFTTNQAGSIVNGGNLSVGNGQNISLIGGNTVNTGRLTAPGGEIQVLAVPGTNRVRLSQPGQVLSLEIVPPVDGVLRAVDLPALLTGSDLPGIQINPAGQVQVAGTSLPNQQGIAVASGRIDVSSAMGNGGTVQVMGDRVAALDARINANGATGGGTVRLGGEYLGGRDTGIAPALRFNSQRTLVDRNSFISANAMTTGNGGRVIVWADDTTGFYGNIVARGGVNGGNGGFAEVSGSQTLTFAGNADLSAPRGTFGTILLDPVNIFINNSADLLGSCILPTVSVGCDPGDITISQATLQSLGAAINIVLEASNNITLGTLTGNALTFAAGPGGSITFRADADGNGVGSFLMNPVDVITARGRNISIQGSSITTGSITTGINVGIVDGGSINLSATENINTRNLDSSIFSSGGPGNGGAITLIAGGNINIIRVDGAAGGNLYIAALNSTSYSRNGGAINLTAGTNIDISSNINPAVISYSQSAFGSGDGGTINLTAGGDIKSPDIWSGGVNANLGILNSGNGGAINLTANGSINTSLIQSFSFYRNAGAIHLNSIGGNITTSSLNASSGSNSLPGVSFGNGGNININASNGSISNINSIFTEAQDTGNGGRVDINTGNLFLVTGSRIARDGTLASISTQGGAGGGAINITHGGSTTVPFLVGNATTNGTRSTITSGTGANTLNNFIVPIPPEVNTYGTNITIRTTIPTPIPAFLIPLLINPTAPPTPAAVVVGTQPPPPEPTPQTVLPSPVISTPAPTPIVVATPIITPTPTVIATPVPTPQNPPSPSPNTIPPGAQSAIATTLTILNSQNSLSNNLGIIDPNLQSSTANNPAIPILTRIPTSSLENILRLLDDPFKEEFQAFNGIGDEIATLDVNQAQNILNRITKETNVKPAFIYVFFTPANDANARDRTVNSARTQLFRNPSNTDTLEVVLVPPTGDLVRVRYNALTRPEVLESAGELTRGVARRSVYGRGSRRMYDLIIAPLEEDLKRLKIDNLVFLLDRGLRSMPISAMQSKDNRFIIEDYSVGLMPSLTLTDTTYSSLKDSQVMAMGANRFEVDGLKPLPGVPVELKAINQIRGGNIFLNENFTLSNLRQNRSPNQRIVHLATHGSFYGDKVNSYIQLWGTERLTLEQIRSTGFGTPPVDLLVLSACETALGNTDAELGFAGLAVTSGVRSALASLWQVSDEGTMGLMAEFYQQLQTTTTKSEALRQAQLAMLRGEVRLEAGSLVTPKGNFTLNEELQKLGDRKLQHPYYWSAFTMIGNPW